MWISVLEAFIPGVLTPIKPFPEEMRTGAALGGKESSHPGLAGASAPARSAGTASRPRGQQQQQQRPAPSLGWATLGTSNPWLSLTEPSREQGHELLCLCFIAALHVHITQITVVLPLICNKYPKYEN